MTHVSQAPARRIRRQSQPLVPTPAPAEVRPLLRSAIHLEDYARQADETLEAWIRAHEAETTRALLADPSLLGDDMVLGASDVAEPWFGSLVAHHGLPRQVPPRSLVAPRSRLTLQRIAQGPLRQLRDQERPLVEELLPQVRAWRINKGRPGTTVQSEDVVDFLDEEDISLSADGRQRLENRARELYWAEEEERWKKEA